MKISPLENGIRKKLLIKKCHSCGHIWESYQEKKKCPGCKKSFLPLNYFEKIKDTKISEYELLFGSSDELEEKDLIKGIHVLW